MWTAWFTPSVCICHNIFCWFLQWLTHLGRLVLSCFLLSELAKRVKISNWVCSTTSKTYVCEKCRWNEQDLVCAWEVELCICIIGWCLTVIKDQILILELFEKAETKHQLSFFLFIFGLFLLYCYNCQLFQKICIQINRVCHGMCIYFWLSLDISKWMLYFLVKVWFN